MLKEGFDVHHIDGDHSNDHPGNLALIEAVDHLRLHGMFGLVKLGLHKTGQRKGGTNRWAGKTQKEKSAHMRMMVMARERKRRKAKRARADAAAHRAANEAERRNGTPCQATFEALK